MKVLIVGGGGREHALAWKVSQSSLVKKVFVAPGNAGTALEKNIENVPISPLSLEELKNFAIKECIDLTIVGPEEPLAVGIKDYFDDFGLSCFGPSKLAAMLEASKTFSKAFMSRHQIPTARYESFTDRALAKSYIQDEKLPIVIKADGLAAGKGVVIAQTKDEACFAIDNMLSEGTAGGRIVIEEFLQGEEVSFIVMTDGDNILPLATSRDYKRRDNGGMGPNTGGMGAYSPVTFVTKEMHKRIMSEIIKPTIVGMKKEGRSYLGFLYAGLMVTTTGEIKLLEYNCRFGDPETQVVLMRLKSDLVSLCQATLESRLNEVDIRWKEQTALGVVLASKGYPEAYQKSDVIDGLHYKEEAFQKIFHAGTKLQGNNVITNGGRVLSVCALGDDISKARQQAYSLANSIHWNGVFVRDDIGIVE